MTVILEFPKYKDLIKLENRSNKEIDNIYMLFEDEAVSVFSDINPPISLKNNEKLEKPKRLLYRSIRHNTCYNIKINTFKFSIILFVDDENKFARIIDESDFKNTEVKLLFLNEESNKINGKIYPYKLYTN